MQTLKNIHPGEILREEFLVPLGISQYRLAVDTNMPHSRVTSIIKERRGITADTAVRLSLYFGTSPEFWLNLQSSFEIAETKKKQLEQEVTPYSVA